MGEAWGHVMGKTLEERGGMGARDGEDIGGEERHVRG